MADDGYFDNAYLEASCPECGSTDYVLVAGYFYCTTCQIQSQYTQELIEDNGINENELNEQSTQSNIAQFLGDRVKKTDAKSLYEENKQQKYITLSSYELFNLFLKDITDQLIKMDFPTKLKDKVFQLWTEFLSERSAILTLENKTEEPDQRMVLASASGGEPIQNLELFHGIRKKYQTTKKKDLSNKSQSNTPTRSKSRKLAFEKSYLESITANEESTTELELPNAGIATPELSCVEEASNETGGPSTPKSNSRPTTQLSITPQAQIVAKALSRNSAKFRKGNLEEDFLETEVVRNLLQHEHVTLTTLFIIVFVAARQIGCKIVLSDLIRMYQDGTLHISRIQRYGSGNSLVIMPPIKLHSFLKINYDQTLIFDQAQNILKYLDIQNFHYPKFAEVLPRFISDCSLPLEFQGLLLHINKMYTTAEDLAELNHKTGKMEPKIFIEFYAIAVIGLYLKLLFGFDGVTERHQARFASTLNRIIRKHQSNQAQLNSTNAVWTELFDVKEWLTHLRQRDQLIEEYKDMELKKRVGLKKTADLTVDEDACDEVVKIKQESDEGSDETGSSSDKYSSTRKKCSKLSIQRAISSYKSFSDTVFGVEMECDIFTRIGPSFPYTFRTRLEKLKLNEQELNPGKSVQLSSAFQDFSRTRIDFVLNPSKYVPIIEKAGYNVRIVSGTAESLSTGSMQSDSKTLILFQPYKKIPEIVSSSKHPSLSFLLRKLQGCISSDKRWTTTKLEGLIQKLMDIYCLRCFDGFIPVI